MLRRIVVSAGLLALLFTVSACACGRGVAPASAKSTGTSSSGADICLPTPCVRTHDCSGCYISEANMNPSRLRDDLPAQGACCDCTPRQRHHHETHDPCAPCGK